MESSRDRELLNGTIISYCSLLLQEFIDEAVVLNYVYLSVATSLQLLVGLRCCPPNAVYRYCPNLMHCSHHLLSHIT